jgi:hypothetical protein
VAFFGQFIEKDEIGEKCKANTVVHLAKIWGMKFSWYIYIISNRAVKNLEW